MKSNSKTSLILLVCAVLAGTAGWYLSNNYINKEISSYRANFDAEREAVPVVVANMDLKVGDLVSTANASIRQIPRAYVPADALPPDAFPQIEGRQVIHPVRQGDPILAFSVSQVKVQGLSSLLKNGERAITIPVSSRDTFSGFMGPGDYIDLMITMKDGDLERTVPLAENLRVLATGTDLDDGVPEKDQFTRVSEITLGVTPLMATRLIHAQTVGDLTVLLRKPEDTEDRFTDYVTIDNLVDIPQAPKVEPPPPPPPKKTSEWGFELIKGGKRS